MVFPPTKEPAVIRTVVPVEKCTTIEMTALISLFVIIKVKAFWGELKLVHYNLNKTTCHFTRRCLHMECTECSNMVHTYTIYVVVLRS